MAAGPTGKPLPTFMVAEYHRCRACEAAAFTGERISAPQVDQQVYRAVAYVEDRAREIVVYAFDYPGCVVSRV